MTTTRSAICATTAMSWVMNITAIPFSRFRRSIRARISAWIVTSSAVVGSSQIRRRGRQAIAMAITTRWRIPPDNSCGYWFSRRSGSGIRTSRSSSSDRARACARLRPRWTTSPSASCSPTVNTGLSDVIGSWKIIPISLPRTSRITSAGCRARSMRPFLPASNRIRPSAMRPPPNSTSRISDSELTDLPDPDSPTTQTHSPGLMEKLTSSTPVTGPSCVSNSTLRPSTETSGAASSSIEDPSFQADRRAVARRCTRRQHRRLMQASPVCNIKSGLRFQDGA